MSATLQKIAELTGSNVIGDSTLEVCSVANLNHATPRDLVFCEDERFLGDAFASPAAAIEHARAQMHRLASAIVVYTEETARTYRMRHPRNKFRCARMLGFTATEGGRFPSGFTRDVSIL